MNGYELAERLGASIALNKLCHPETGEVLARFEEAELVLTQAGLDVIASLPAAPAKTTRARKPATVESAEVTPEVVAPAPATEAPQPDAAPTE